MILPVILSGGAGTRLWPVSRDSAPKPFMRMADGLSLLQKTLLRVGGIPDLREIVTVTNREYYFRTKDEYAACNISPDVRRTYILEPVSRNTGPAIAMASRYAQTRFGPDAIVAVFASDHAITGDAAFLADIAKAVSLAEADRLVVFGIPPHRPETGYGYIQLGASLAEPGTYEVGRFVEKPPAEQAARYLESGDFLWNSGMFVFKARHLESLMQAHAPQLAESARRCWDASQKSARADEVIELAQEAFRECPEISFDYAVVERAAGVAVVKAEFGWNDVGSWDAVSDLLHPDASGNRIVGDAVLHDVSNTYIQAEDRVIAAIGVSNLVIVDTSDALLVADRDRSQDVRRVVDQLKRRDHASTKVHRTVSRPWGFYTVLEEGERFKIKRIVVKPKHALSLQMHHHRSEHWVVVSGAASVTKGDETLAIGANESTFIPARVFHRLENPGNVDLVVIEVASGDYLGEDDIVRVEDRYGRV